MKFTLEQIEIQLKKRLSFPYKWYGKQNDEWDRRSDFIYQTFEWEALLKKISVTIEGNDFQSNPWFNYTINRWFNFWSAMAVEQIFCGLAGVEAEINPKNREVDFKIFDIPFDHKTSVFPKNFNKSIEYAQSNEGELIEWFYKNQSSEKRHHLKNRLFVIVYNTDGAHWKLKADLQFLKMKIEKYVVEFTPAQLHSFTFATGFTTQSDVIWAIK